MTPTDRTRAYYTTDSLMAPRGAYVLGRVERHIHAGAGGRIGAGGYRKDLFGLFDFVGMRRGDPLLGIQSCGPDFKAHFVKMTQEHGLLLSLWLSTGCEAELIGWRQLGGKWAPKIHRFCADDILG